MRTPRRTRPLPAPAAAVAGAAGQPAHQWALAQYRQRAAAYDSELAPFEPLRRQAVDGLALQRGQTVIDAGCGTGLSFSLLQPAIGPEGCVVGIEQCPEMLARADVRIVEHGWRNVQLIGSSVEDAVWARQADAALFHFTHDILCSPPAVSNVLRHLKPGARVVAVGLQWAPVWAWPVNGLVWLAALYSVTSVEHLAQPWSELERQLGGLDVGQPLPGFFVASGRMPLA